MPVLFTSCTAKVKLVTGSYSETGTGGINIFDFDEGNGSLTNIASFNAGSNPSYLCLGKMANMIYAINEVDSFIKPHCGGVTAVVHNGSFGELILSGSLAVPNGGPCYISESPDNKYLLVANYGGGSVAVVKLDDKGIPAGISDTILFTGEQGTVSHAHMIGFDPAGEKIYVTDLGLDRVWIFSLDRNTGKLIASIPASIDLPKGTGPRHFTFNRAGTVMYVIGELNSTLTVLKADRKNGLVPVQTISTLREGDTVKNACADIHLGLSEKYLYGSNRGENTIVTYSVGNEGKLKLAGHTDCGGIWPRNFTIDPSGKFLLVGNQLSNNIAVFSIDQKTGLPSSKVFDFKVPSPVCLKFK